MRSFSNQTPADESQYLSNKALASIPSIVSCSARCERDLESLLYLGNVSLLLTWVTAELTRARTEQRRKNAFGRSDEASCSIDRQSVCRGLLLRALGLRMSLMYFSMVTIRVAQTDTR